MALRRVVSLITFLMLPLPLILALGLPTTAQAQEGGARREEQPPPKKAAPVLTAPPELLEGATPTYPPAAEKAGLEADVTVRISIAAAGAVTKAEVVTAVGNGFDEAAVEAARRYKFKPAEFDGKPGPIVVETTIHFRLQVVEEPDPVVEDNAANDAAKGKETLRGVVKERGTRRKLAGITVALAELNREAITDTDGKFVLDQLPPGTYRIIVLATGFDRFDEKIVITAGEITEASIYIRPKGGSPYETVVEAEREKMEVTRHTVSRRQMTTVPGTFGDPIRVLQNLPGMNRAPYIAGILLIRGSNPDDSGVYVDGHKVPLLYHFLGGPSILNPEFLDSLALYPGGFPSRFGRNLGGVIEVETCSTKSDGIHGAADVDLIDSSLYLRAPIGKKVGIAFAARRSYLDTLLPFFLPDTGAGETLVVVPVYWDYQARLDVDLPGRDKFSVMAFGSSDTLDLLASDDEATFDLNSHVGFNRLRATYETPLYKKLTLSLSASGGYDDVSFAGGERTSLEISQSVVGLRERVRGEISKRFRIDTGIDLEYRVTDYTIKLPFADDIPADQGGSGLNLDPELFRRSIDAYTIGAYFEAAIDFPNRLRLIPGLRVDGYLLAGEPRVSVDPRLVARWQLDDPTALKAYVGLFHQPPQPEGFDAQFGNPDLEIEQAIHTGFGIERKLLDNVSVESEVYYVDRRNLAVFTDEVIQNPDGTISPVFWKNEMVGRTYGLEVLLRHDVTRNFYGWISYTLARAEQRRHPDEPYSVTAFDSTHNLILVGSYKTDGGWEFGARFRAVTGLPQTPVLGGTYDADADHYEPLRGEIRSARRAFFHQLDIRIEKTWTFDTWRFGAYLDIMNLYDAENPEATQYDYRYKESAPVRGVPFVPTIGIRGDW